MHKDHFKQHAVSVPCKTSNPKLSRSDCPKADFEISEMSALYSVYRSVLGGPVHITNWTHPELAFVVSVASMYMSNPGKKHFDFLMVVLQYCLGVQDKALVFRGWGERVAQWIGYSDSDYGADESRRSRTGYCWYFAGNLISWCSKLQHSVTLSTAESEYQALCAAAQEMIWLKRLSSEFGFNKPGPITLYSDNKACIAIAHNPVQHKYTKHIDVRLHFVRELIQRSVLDVQYIQTGLNIADIFTKGLASKLFIRHRDALYGLVAVGPVSLEQHQIMDNLKHYIGFDEGHEVSHDVAVMASIFKQCLDIGV